MRMDNSKIKKIIICLLVVAIFIMGSAYAVLYRELRINGNASVVASWKIGITGIKEGNKVGSAVSSSIPIYTVSTASFNAELHHPDDSIEYIITIENSGGIDAKLDKITVATSGDETIVYEIIGVTEGSILKAGESINVTIKVSVNKNVTVIENKAESSLTAIFNYIQNV